MTPKLDFELPENGPLTKDVRILGFDHFLSLAEYVRQLPYGRPSDSGDFLSVLNELRGTCSFKHRLLAAVAHECEHMEVELVVGLYAMSEQNTPGVGVVLDRAGFASIPEAHCYLRLGNQRHDFTGVSAGSSSPFDALLSEHVMYPEHLTEEKKSLHQEAIRKWASHNDQSFEDAWALREACIQALASNNTLKQTTQINKTPIL
ncbi:hypothetical protein [Vibrio palustris]|uniref:Uncharacterized protein n=1 Tax=Vibrio palustris TaxID=1918946 RepID=A0A1R4B740_9VIBR|nr:hypothetical protein [Vibrio palustris]SJL84730.1 hypothetical protein VPAL9027_02727 [Vibrio palustris]